MAPSDVGTIPPGGTGPRGTVERGGWRATLLTPSLLRVESGPRGSWTDLPTQVVATRDLGNPGFETRKAGRFVDIVTTTTIFRLDARDGRPVSVAVLGDATPPRFVPCSARGNLGGTRRTLDNTAGPARVGKGILSRSGVAVLDDSASLLLGGDGMPRPRSLPCRDRYVFAYGTRYREALSDFFRLAGAPPVVPRFALGNWWSRYHAYSQAEYEALMDRFEAEGIPLAVATVDMDWHWVDLSRFKTEDTRPAGQNLARLIQGSGWTGYSWNTDLFPDWKAFLEGLHKRGLRVTLNLHPADGVRPFEDAWRDMCAALGRDPSKREPIAFDPTDPAFLKAYFEVLHHPLEEAGVDFWWLDWQQGRRTKVPGLDPLWALNHFHYLDSERKGKGLILSRYAGPGSHRYPLGFSGDTSITWKTLAFQPRFTAMASNIGYGWWSHDIGGHHHGRRDDELYLRWLQFAVFNPVLRLHSTSHPLLGKEPWRFRPDVARLAREALVLRHRLLPWLHSQNWACHLEGRTLVEPMYYGWPEAPEAYEVPDQYLFGRDLLVCPVITPTEGRTGFARARAWLPPGRWTDLFTGKAYEGGRFLTFARNLESIPVLAREGAIIVMAAEGEDGLRNPARLELALWRGDGELALREDADGLDPSRHDPARHDAARLDRTRVATTRIRMRREGAVLRVSVAPAEGDLDLLPGSRSYTLRFRDVAAVSRASLYEDGTRRELAVRKEAGGGIAVDLEGRKPQTGFEVLLEGIEGPGVVDWRETCVDLLSRWQAGNGLKRRRWKAFGAARNAAEALGAARRARLPASLKAALLEALEGPEAHSAGGPT